MLVFMLLLALALMLLMAYKLLDELFLDAGSTQKQNKD
jgi:hypothetical protein